MKCKTSRKQSNQEVGVVMSFLLQGKMTLGKRAAACEWECLFHATYHLAGDNDGCGGSRRTARGSPKRTTHIDLNSNKFGRKYMN